MAETPQIQQVPESINFPAEEEKILELWKKLDVFKSCLKQSEGKPRFSFYDGPPFATGLPHYGHILAGTIKDVVTRFAHQNGFHVERRFGWDTHGLPVEYEVDKALGITGPDDVMKMGIKAYNDECRKIVMRYSNEWEHIVGRLGRWIDFENDYKTMYPWFMESVWWVFKQMFQKNMVYRGFKVMPFSTACCTPLSNFEMSQNYKDVVDPAVIVSFPLVSRPEVSLLAWTTTPWTLPSNLALCVNPDLIYVEVEETSSKKHYILMEARIEALFKKESDYTIIDKFPGKNLKDLKYVPIFNYFEEQGELKGAFRVLTDSYVTAESGTGIVHQAPYFGADDYRICLEAGIITKDQDMICPIDYNGKFVEPVKDFLGKYVKDADKPICANLKARGRLIHSGTIKHSYPFCWRSDTPLIYRAIPSWFIRVEPLVEKLLANNQKTYWVPDFVKEKRFANWLRDARDWAVSRNRYWGTPMPIWMSEDGEETVCIGSREELAKLSGQPAPEDLHREIVDEITIPSSRPGQPPLRRVKEVFDCWFESGSMPYAQNHYPFERKDEFEKGFPADFIAEGIDQTRGWFYTLLVVSTALFDKPPFKNLIVNGLVLASDGQKMSKRKKNYPDPVEVVNKFGADALRLYLINSPVVKAENLRFQESGVKDLLKDVFLPWFNAYRFFVQNVLRVDSEDNVNLKFDDKLNDLKATNKAEWNVMDRWILSSIQSLVAWFHQEMDAYRLYTVVPRLVKFVDQLTNWYVRLNRRRIRGEAGSDESYRALEVLFLVLHTLARLMAPFTPFITEHMYQNLKRLQKNHSEDGNEDSIHFLMLPKTLDWLVDKDIEESVGGMQTVINLGRLARDRANLPIKSPLPEVIVIHNDPLFLEEVKKLENYILEELNVKKITLSTDKSAYNVKLTAEPDHKVLGQRFKNEFRTILSGVKGLKSEELEECLKNKCVIVAGHTIDVSEMYIKFSVEGTSKDYEVASSGPVLVILNTKRDQNMMDEGNAREIINRIQKLRKKVGLIPTDKVTVYLEGADSLKQVIEEFTEFIQKNIKAPIEPLTKAPADAKFLIQEKFDDIKDMGTLTVALHTPN